MGNASLNLLQQKENKTQDLTYYMKTLNASHSICVTSPNTLDSVLEVFLDAHTQIWLNEYFKHKFQMFSHTEESK